jgi:hypothetical protein
MNVSAPYSLIQSQTGILKTDGSIVVSFSSPVVNNSYYYIRVTHRNHIETWSSMPGLFNGVTFYDFSTSSAKSYGSNQYDLGDGNYALFSADISDATSATTCLQDGIVESQDYVDMENAVYVTLLGYVCQDITGDGVVESSDYGLMENAVYFTRVMQRP